MDFIYFDQPRPPESHKNQYFRSYNYQLTLESMEAKIITHENNEVAWAEKYEQQD